MWGLFYHYYSYEAYPNFFYHVLPLGLDHFPLVAVQVDAICRLLCPDYVRRIQSIPLPQPGWLISFYEHLLGKDQEGLLASARESPRMHSLSGVLISGSLKVWPYCNSKQGDYDLIFLGRSETFRPGPVRYPRPGPRLLGRSCQESRQCKSKSIATIILQYLWDRLKVSLREQAH